VELWGGGSWLAGPPPRDGRLGPRKTSTGTHVVAHPRARGGGGGTPVVEEAHHVGRDHVGELQAVDGQQLQERGRGGEGGGRREGVGPPPGRG